MRNTVRTQHVLLFILMNLIGLDLALSASAEEVIGTACISVNGDHRSHL